MTFYILTAAILGHQGHWGVFLFPFFLMKIVFLIFLFKLIFRVFIGKRLRKAFGPEYSCASRDQIREKFRNMTDEERKAFFGHRKHRCNRNKHTDEEGFVNPINK